MKEKKETKISTYFVLVTILIVKDLDYDELIPEGSYMIAFNYKGDIDEQDYYRSLLEVVNYIPKIANNRIKNVEKYYKKNKDKLLVMLGIKNLEDFKDFINYLNSKGDIKKFQKAVVDKESFEDKKEYTKFNLNLIYLNNVTLNFEVHFMNDEYSLYYAEYIVN